MWSTNGSFLGQKTASGRCYSPSFHATRESLYNENEMPVIAYSEIMPELIVHNCITIPPVNLPIVYPNDTLNRLARIHQVPMTLIHAPAGYGKTVTTAHWSAQQPLPVAWVTLNTHNQQPQHVLRYIATALKQASLMAQQSLDVGADAGIPTNGALLTLFHTIAVEQKLARTFERFGLGQHVARALR